MFYRNFSSSGALLLAVLSLCTPRAPAAELSPAAQAGLRIYRDGVLPDGAPLQARRAGVGLLRGAEAACENCHRRSGIGSSEGRQIVPAIAGALLMQAAQPYRPQRPGRPAGLPLTTLRHQSRSAYDLASLGRALRDGVDPNGQAFSELMPRYELTPAQVEQVEAYLQTLPVSAPAGIEAGTIHLATILTPNAPAARREVLQQTLQGWAASATLRGLRVQLQVWALEGPAERWPQQLTRWQRERPVYAVLSGAGSADWAPVQEFCDAARLPCLLPLLDQLPAGRGSFYSLYFSAGVEGEAAIAAQHLTESGWPTQAVQPELLQIQQDDVTLSQAAARQFSTSWQRLRQERGTAAALPELRTQAWPLAPQPLAAAASAPTSHASPAASSPDTTAAEALPPAGVVALWLPTAAVQALVTRWPQGWPGASQVLLSAQLSDPRQLQLPPAWQRQVRWASLHADPVRQRAGRAMVMSGWLKRLGLSESPEPAQAEAYAAVFYLGDAMARMRLSWSGEHLLEQLEYSVNNRPAGAAFFSLSLGPNQRIAAKSGRMLGYAAPGAAEPVPLGPLIRPED